MGRLQFIKTPALYVTSLSPGEVVKHSLKPGRHAWVHVASGAVTLNGHSLATGDAAAVSEELKLTLAAVEPSEVLLFDLA